MLDAIKLNLKMINMENLTLSSLSNFKLLCILIFIIIHICILSKEIQIWNSDNTNFKHLKSGIWDTIFIKNVRDLVIGTVALVNLYSSILTINSEHLKNELINDRKELYRKFQEVKAINSQLNNQLANSEGLNLAKQAKFQSTHGKLTEQIYNTSGDFATLEKMINEIVNISDKLKEVKAGSSEAIKLQSQLDESKLQIDIVRFKLNNQFGSIQKNATELQNTVTDTNQEITKVSQSFVGLDLLPSFENLNGIGQLAFSLILLNYVILSSLITLAYIFYGDYLIKRFNLEVKYPKLAKVIALRRKFQTYYFTISFLTIAVIAISEILASIYILTL